LFVFLNPSPNGMSRLRFMVRTQKGKEEEKVEFNELRGGIM
jgi:hypothetical protein